MIALRRAMPAIATFCVAAAVFRWLPEVLIAKPPFEAAALR